MAEELTKEWVEFDYKKGYQKKMQDIMLSDGEVVMRCWPNANFWNVCGDGPYYGQELRIQAAHKIRLTHSEK